MVSCRLRCDTQNSKQILGAGLFWSRLFWTADRASRSVHPKILPKTEFLFVQQIRKAFPISFCSFLSRSLSASKLHVASLQWEAVEKFFFSLTSYFSQFGEKFVEVHRTESSGVISIVAFFQVRGLFQTVNK